MNRARVFSYISLLCLQPWSVAGFAAADSASATEAVQIILKIPSRIEWREVPPQKTQSVDRSTQLCVGHVPADQYQVIVTREGQEHTEVEGRSGRYCLPTHITENAQSVTIVAQ